MNDIFLYNAEDCTFWAFDALSDVFNGILLFIEDDQPGKGILSFSFAFHKAPLAWYSCKILASDYKEVVDFYTAITSPTRKWGDYVTIVFWNVFFNGVDLMYEILTLYGAA